MHDIDREALARWLDERTMAGLFSGVVLVRRGDETLFAYGSGLASRAHGIPNTLHTRFGVASVTKWPVATTLLRLVERGELSLGARLVDLLPVDQQPRALTPAHTLHQLLSQTSGLANYHDDDAPNWDSFEAAIARMPGRGRVPADLVPLYRDLPARRPPGEAYEYSDTNFVLAGLVLEAVTGREWSSVMTDEVLAPVGMTATSVEALDEDPAGVATGYLVDDGPAERRRTNVFSLTARGMPDGGMFTTAGDLAAFVDALLGGRLLGPELLSAMLRPHASSTGDPEQYGYGCLLGMKDGRVTVVGHGGSDPGVACTVAHHLDAGVTIVVLCNQDRGAWPATLEVARMLGLRDPRAPLA
ncbi:MAG TPA: serine hydrolase domain-containing protein [Candidatus Limnocylindrales bacterium]|jgi:CubicO group peptidase (beta-lactamase class C family)